MVPGLFENAHDKTYFLITLTIEDCPSCPVYVRRIAGWEGEDGEYHPGAVDRLNESDEFEPSFKAGVLNASKKKHRELTYSVIHNRGYWLPNPRKLLEEGEVDPQYPFPQVVLASNLTQEGRRGGASFCPRRYPRGRSPT